MSQETMEWLNNNTLIGCTDMRITNGQPATAWHYMECYQGDELIIMKAQFLLLILKGVFLIGSRLSAKLLHWSL